MVSADEFDWIEQQLDGDFDHLLIGTSLPWLLPRALHELESWDEVLCDGQHGERVARFGEWLRRAADLEHWAAFRKSFDKLAELLAAVGGRDNAPASICVLSGDVHHAYMAEAELGPQVRSKVYQLTCSPLHNHVPAPMKLAFRVFWTRVMEWLFRVVLHIVTKVPPLTVRWKKLTGPYFGNEMAELVIRGRTAETVLRKSARSAEEGGLCEVARVKLSG
jgi:hypothetical protein